MDIPLDETSLKLLREALDVTIVDTDLDGNPILSGDFSLNRLLEFWSGYDESKLQEGSDGISVYPEPILSERDLIRALVDEVARIRRAVYLGAARVLEDELEGDLHLDLNVPEQNTKFWALVERIEKAVLDEPEAE